MTSKIYLLVCLVVVTIQGLSQVHDVRKETIKSFRRYSKGQNRLITNKNVVPNEFFFYKKNNNALHTIMLVYPYKKYYWFWIVEDKLVRITSRQDPTKTSKGHTNDYFFANDSLVSQIENYKDSLNVDDLKKLYKNYKAKAMTP